MCGHVGLCAEILPLTCVCERNWGFTRPVLLWKGATIVGPIEMIVATFEHDEEKAAKVLKGLQEAAAEGALHLDAAAVIVNVGDVDAKHGRVFGAITGAVVGLLGGPVGAVVGGIAGAATGGAAARFIDRGVPNRLIKDVENGLHPGSSAIIAYVELDWIDRAVSTLQAQGAVVHRETINEPLINALLKDPDERWSED
jgi:uncharacterized membrane protein